MWGECKDWLLQGGIPNDPKLAFDLGAPGWRDSWTALSERLGDDGGLVRVEG
jgi:hypothetical protein